MFFHSGVVVGAAAATRALLGRAGRGVLGGRGASRAEAGRCRGEAIVCFRSIFLFHKCRANSKEVLRSLGRGFTRD